MFTRTEGFIDNDIEFDKVVFADYITPEERAARDARDARNALQEPKFLFSLSPLLKVRTSWWTDTKKRQKKKLEEVSLYLSCLYRRLFSILSRIYIFVIFIARKNKQEANFA